MKDSLVRFLIIVPLIFGGCSPGSRNDAPAGTTPVDVTPTYEPPKPTIVKEQGFQIARGATQVKDIHANYDNETKSMRLTGSLEYLTVGGRGYQKLDVNLVGMLDEDGFIVMKPAPEQKAIENVTIAAKATCLSEEGTCTSSFIDIYLYTDGVVYHQQFETKEKATTPAKPNDSAKKDDTSAYDKNAKKEDDEHEEESEGTEYEGGADEAEGEAGPYIGTVHDDIENILNIKPVKEEPKNPISKEERDERADAARNEREKREQEKKDQEKKDQEKRDQGKKDEPKKDDSKKEDPKKDQTRLDPKDDKIPKPSPRPDHEDEKKDDSKEDQKEEPKEEKKDEPAAKPKIKPANQVVGSVNNGRLENGVNMKKHEDENSPVGFHIIRPERKRHFATNEMSYLIQLMGKMTSSMIPGYKLAVGDISAEKGGKIGSHLSHKTGLDADVAFYFNNKTFQGYFASALAMNKPHANWMVEEQWKLYKAVGRTQLIDRIFIHETLKKEICALAIKNGEITKETKSGAIYETLRRLIADKDHITHFHMRAKCSSAQVRCRPLPEPRPGTGCF